MVVTPMSSTSPVVVHFALFGLGRIGSIHCRNILKNPSCDLKYVVEPDMQRAYTFFEKEGLGKDSWPQICDINETENILSDPALHAVMCAATTSEHERIIRACFAHKIPVFSEKPIAETVDATLAVCQESTEVGVPLLCGFNRRFDAQFLEMKNRLQSGEVGRLMMIKSTSRDYPTNCPIEYIKISGGQFVDQTVHDIDVCLWMAGERPHTVFAMGHAFYEDIAKLGDTDTTMLQLQFPSGVMASIDNSRRATFGYDTRLELYGEDGQLSLENVRPSAIVAHNEEGEKRCKIYDHFSSRFPHAYENELVHFIACLRGEVSTLRISPEEAYAAVNVSKAAADSYKLGTPVRIDW